MSFHSDQTANHVLQNYTYNDEAARLAASGFVAADVGKVALQVDDTTFWILRTTTPSWLEITGDAAGSDFSAVKDNEVPVNRGSQIYDGSGVLVDSKNAWTFEQKISVPSGSVVVGTTLELSEGGSELVAADLIKEQMAFSINSDFTDSVGSSIPHYIDWGPPQSFNFNLDDSVSITTNPLTFNVGISGIPTGYVQLTDRITLRAGAAMTNFRAKLTDNATGIVLRHIPSKAAFDGDADGLDLVAGDNVFFLAEQGTDVPGIHYLGYVPIVSVDGQIIDIELVADGMNILGDATGDPYMIAEIHVGPERDLGLAERADRVQTTGLLEGGVISAASTTTVDWTSGRGQVTDYIDPENPDIHEVIWDAVVGLTPANIATDGLSVFGYDEAGSVVEKLASDVAIADAHETIWFGAVTHIGGIIVSVLTTPGNLAYDGLGSFADFMGLVIGPANIDGNVYGPGSTNLTVEVLGGNAFIIGSNFRNDPSLSDIVTLPSFSTTVFFKVYRSDSVSSGILYDGVPALEVDPTQYDDGSGTLQAVPGGQWTIQRIFRSRDGATVVAYGQETFANKNAALDALGSEAFEEKSPLPLALFRCSLVVSSTATDLSNTAQAEFFTQSSFRLTGATSSSSTIPGITNPGGPDGSIQFNSAGVFGGESDFSYDSTTKTVSLAAAAAGDATIEFINSIATVKGTVGYDEAADEFRIDVSNGLSTLHLNEVLQVFRGTNDGRIDIEPETDIGASILTLSNEAGGTGLQIEFDDVTDDSSIIGEIGNITISTVQADEDIILSPTGNVGITRTDPDSVLHIYEDTTETGIQAGLTIEQDGVGDAIAQFLLSGGQRWVMGIDNSGSDAFKIASSIDLASNSQLVLETDGRSEFLGQLGINILPTSTMHIYEDTAEVGAAAGLTIEQDGTGDAVAQFLLTGDARWVMGIDNSDSDNFVFAKSADLNSNRQLILQDDGKSYFLGTLGVNKVPDDNYTLDVSATTTQVVGLFSSKAVTIEGRNFAEGNSTDFFFNRGNVGFNQSEFAMFNANTASGGLRHFKMFYSDFNEEVTEIGFSQTRGGNIGIGRDVPSNKFHVQLAPATGTGTVENVTNNVLDGTGTAFLTELRVGGYVFINSEVRTVTSITSDTVAGISSDFTAFPITPAVAFTFNYPTFALDNSGNAKLGGNGTPTERFQIDTIGADVVELRSDKAVTLEVGTFGSSDSTDFIFNKGDVGTDQSEFVMLNDNNASTLARYFRMSFSDDIGVSGGITVWKERNNVAIGPYTEPDSVLTVSENTTETGDQAGLTIIQEGTGDAIAQFLLDGGQRWVMGIDNSASDAFKIASSINLGSNDMFVLSHTAGAFINSHTDKVLQLQNATGNWSMISVDDAGSPEGVVTGQGGDIHINADGEQSIASIKKSAASNTADWYDIDLVPPLIKVIYNTAEFEAMASGGIITVDSNTTWIFKGHIDSDVRVVFDGATLHISTDQSNQSSWTYSGTGTLLTGEGGLRSLEFMDLLSSSTGTFADLDMGGRSMNLTLAGLFNWDDLGSLSNGTFILDVSDIFDNVLGFDFFNMKVTITQSNITNTPTSALPLFTLDNSFGAKSVSVDQLTGSFNAGASLFRIEPALNDAGKVAVGGIAFQGGQIFDVSGSTGSFTAVADAAVPAEAITSVTDSSGVARFNFTAPPTLFINQEVVISGFTTNTAYNGTYIITATGAGYFEVATIAFGSNETGSFLSNSVTITETGTALVDGDQITLDTDGTIDYDGGATVYNQLTNTFQVNRTFTATATGTWSTEGLDQSDPRVLAFNNPDYIDSRSFGYGHIEENPSTTPIGVTDTYQAITLGGLTGFITVFANNGSGGTTCTSAAHGLVENQNIVISGGDEYYRGAFTVFNVLTNSFDIAITFSSTVLTSDWDAGFSCDNERFKCTDAVTGELTYIGNEPFKGSVRVGWSVFKSGNNEDYLFNIGKNGASPDGGNPYVKRTVSTSTSFHLVNNPVDLVKGDTIQPILATVGTTNSINIENIQIEIS